MPLKQLELTSSSAELSLNKIDKQRHPGVELIRLNEHQEKVEFWCRAGEGELQSVVLRGTGANSIILN